MNFSKISNAVQQFWKKNQSCSLLLLPLLPLIHRRNDHCEPVILLCASIHPQLCPFRIHSAIFHDLYTWLRMRRTHIQDVLLKMVSSKLGVVICVHVPRSWPPLQTVRVESQTWGTADVYRPAVFHKPARRPHNMITLPVLY